MTLPYRTGNFQKRAVLGIPHCSSRPDKRLSWASRIRHCADTFRTDAFPITCGVVKKTTFPSPQDAETAFYEALEGADLDAMMEVWAEDEEVVCVHPGGERLVGYSAVRAGWAQIAASGRRLKVHLSDQMVLSGMMVTVHSLQENISVQGQSGAAVPVTVTNVYLRTGNGWRMIVHHASPAPQGTRSAQPAAGDPKVLH